MFMLLGASVLSLKITLLSSRCLCAVPLFTCLTTNTHIVGVVVVGQIKVFGHGKTSSMVAGIVIISLHRPKVLTKTVRKFTAGFSDVQHVTSLAKDRIDHAGGSTIKPPFEVNTSARGSYRISLRRVVTSATPGSVAWSCSGWEAKVLWTKMSRRLLSR